MQAALMAAPHASWVACKPGGGGPPQPHLLPPAAHAVSSTVLTRSHRLGPQLRASAAANCASIQQGWQQRQRLVTCSAAGREPQQPQALACASRECQPGDQSQASSCSSSSGAGHANHISSGYATDSDDGSADVGSESEGSDVTIDLQLPRRSLLVQFTCNACGERSERLVNPIAWNKGLVIAQCQHCQAWHKLADAANLVEEIRYADLEDE